MNWDVPSPPNAGYPPATASIGDSVVLSWTGVHNVVVLPGRAPRILSGGADCVLHGLIV